MHLACEKHFDTSGKSLALFHDRATFKPFMTSPDGGRFDAIAGQNPDH
jgi:hypothetical protein